MARHHRGSTGARAAHAHPHASLTTSKRNKKKLKKPTQKVTTHSEMPRGMAWLLLCESCMEVVTV